MIILKRIQGFLCNAHSLIIILIKNQFRKIHRERKIDGKLAP